jgi:hypothetical protein
VINNPGFNASLSSARGICQHNISTHSRGKKGEAESAQGAGLVYLRDSALLKENFV